MAMNLNNLKIFINIADAGNITRAAEALHITQPSTSKALKNLEDDLGVALFIRDKRTGITLTDTGARILGYARQMMLMEEKIFQTAYMARNMLEGTLKIASLPSGTRFFLAKTFAMFRQKYPQVRVEILESSALDVNRMVSEHIAEFGISLIPAGDFEYEVLMDDNIMAISKAPIDAGCVDLSKLKQNFYVCQAAWESIQPVLERSNIKEYGRFQVVSDQTVRAMAEEGIGIGLQADSILPKETGPYYRYPVKPFIKADLILIANKFDELSPAANAFIETLHDCIRESDAPGPS